MILYFRSEEFLKVAPGLQQFDESYEKPTQAPIHSVFASNVKVLINMGSPSLGINKVRNDLELLSEPGHYSRFLVSGLTSYWN